MRDPHVESLRYRLELNEACGRLENPPPLEHETDAYRMRLGNGVLTVEMKEHHASVESARRRVENDLRAWELDSALERDQAWLKFLHDGTGTKIVDREVPEPGQTEAVGNIVLSDMAVAGVAKAESPVFKEYPKPPAMFEPSIEVEVMIQRYGRAVFDDSQMLSFGYACLSWLEGSTGLTGRQGARNESVCRYRIERNVLDTLGDFVSERGGLQEARKLDANATLRPLTPDENTWVRAALKVLIRRKAACDRNRIAAASLPIITMADLPNL
jgi:hypothetical protein